MAKKLEILIMLTILNTVFSLHFQNPSVLHLELDKQLLALRDQQSAFEKQIVGLIDDIKSIELKVNASTTSNQKVIILENAIISERQKIFQLQNSIIPPFNLSKNACQQLTNDQKIKMLDQLHKAKNEIAKLKAIAAKLPTNSEVTSVISDIGKQETILDGIQKVIYSKCETSVVFTPTIFQSNLIAPNWILGKQTINNIVQQYYQRSRLYQNVTNCPAVSPFFDGTKCIKCEQPTPIFNMQQSQCEKCPFDTKLNIDKHVCEQIPHFTDYKALDNYILDGATLPVSPAGITPCSSLRPYFDGTCVKCSLPNYWNVKENKCKDCPTGQVFDTNTKACTISQGDTLTYIEGTSRWVTSPGNFTNILKERADLVKNNPSKYKYCGRDSPYFDGITCINCPNEFSLAEKKCITAPTGSVYNPNLHAYVAPQAGKETNPSASNLLAPAPLPQPKNPCDLQKPYYDGISCIQCPDPFPLFDTTSKKCVRCSAFEQYDKATLKCIKRSITFISSNFNDLMSTPTIDLNAYKAELLNKVKNNGDSIIKQCNPDQYSNFTNCFKCQKTQKFNIQTKKCDTCNGTVDPKTLNCDPSITFLTNLDANNLIVGTNSTIKTYSQAQTQVLGPIMICPNDKPYAVGGSKCISCPDPNAPYFDLQTQKCVNCLTNLFFNSVTHKCQKEIFITNILAIKRFIEVDNFTVANIKKQLDGIAKTRKTNLCPEATPIATPQGDKCIACDVMGYFNLKTKECVLGLYISNVPALKASGKVIQSDGITLELLQAEANAIVQPKVTCPADKPLLSNDSCIGCQANEYYHLKNSACYKPKLVNNFQALQKSNKVLQLGGVTLKTQQEDIKKAALPTNTCPPETPLSDGTKCITCSPDKYYNLKEINCFTPLTISNIDALSQSKRVIEQGEDTLANLQKSYATAIVPIKCPEVTPYFNGVSCISCPEGQFYNLKTKSCYTPLKSTNLNFLSTSKLYIQVDNYTLANVITLQSKSPYPTTPCPEKEPIWNGQACIGCPQGNYYFLNNYTCYTPKQVTNVAILSASKNYIESGGVTLQQIEDSNKKEKLPVKNCPDTTPLFDGAKCIGCTVEQFYGLEKKVCLNVSVVSNTDAITLQNNYIDKGNATLVNLAIAAKKVPQPKRICPSSAPLFNGTNCIPCKPKLYNIQSLQCGQCASDQNYDINTHTCLKKPEYIPNINNTLWIVSSDAGLSAVRALVAERSAISRSEKCPDDRPHFNNNSKTCESCAKDTYWNYETLKCMSCGAGQQVDPNTRKCGKKIIGKFQTNLNSKNLLFQGKSKTQLLEEYEINRQKYPQIKDCPPEKPYFDDFQCISCPVDRPQFGLLSKLCQVCQPNTIYDEQNKLCYAGKEPIRSNPSTTKMYSSIF